MANYADILQISNLKGSNINLKKGLKYKFKKIGKICSLEL